MNIYICIYDKKQRMYTHQTHVQHHCAFSVCINTKLALCIILFILFCKSLSELYPFIL